MRRLIIVVLSLAVGLAAISFAAAPYIAFFAVRSAADAQDVQGLNQLVDFDAVRTSLKTTLAPPAPAAAPSVWKDPLGAFQNAIRPLEQPAPNVDAYLTPKSLSALTRGYAQDSSRPQAPTSGPGPWPSVKYWGFNRCRLAVHANGHGDTLFTFERRGVYAWKLVQIGLPAR